MFIGNTFFVISHKYPKLVQAEIKTNYMLVLTDLVKTKYPRLCLQLLRCPKDVIFSMQPAASMSHEQSLFPKSSASLILFEKCSLHTAFWGLFSTFYLTCRNFFLRTLGICCQRWPWLTVNWRFHQNHHKEQQKDEFKHFSMRKKRPKKTQSKYNYKERKVIVKKKPQTPFVFSRSLTSPYCFDTHLTFQFPNLPWLI